MENIWIVHKYEETHETQRLAKINYFLEMSNLKCSYLKFPPATNDAEKRAYCL
jgi:hypothetical protein